ncbi:MAG: hypothetical protein AAB796_00385 [Patescibacteria group bacterium]
MNTRQKNTISIIAAISSVAIGISALAQGIQNPLGQGSTISSVIGQIVDFIFSLGLAISVIVLAIGAYQYLFSFGSEQKVEQAHKTLWYAVLGIIIMLVGKGLATLITNILK